MKQNRGRQAASVVRAPTTFVDIDPTIPVSWIKQCEAHTRKAISRDFKKDPELKRKEEVQPFDPREDAEIRRQLHHRPVSITQKITRVLPRVDENARTEAVPMYGYKFYEEHTIVDKYATVPMEPVLR